MVKLLVDDEEVDDDNNESFNIRRLLGPHNSTRPSMSMTSGDGTNLRVRAKSRCDMVIFVDCKKNGNKQGTEKKNYNLKMKLQLWVRVCCKDADIGIQQ